MPSFPPLGSITICEINRDLVTAYSYSDDRANETYGKTLGMVFSPVTFDAAQLLQPSPDEMVEQPGGIERYCGVYDTLKKRYVDLLPQIHTQRVSWHQRKHILAFISGHNQVTICDFEDSSQEGDPSILTCESQRDVKVIEWRPNGGKSLAVACKGGICIWSASYPGNAPSMRLGAKSSLGTLSRGSGTRWTLVDFLQTVCDEQLSALSWSPYGRYLASASYVFSINSSFTIWDVAEVRPPLSANEGEFVENKCTVKRRRRLPSNIGQGVDQQQSHGDQATTTTTTVKRSSRFRGVSRHRWTGRYGAHLWDKASWNPTQRKKGKQVYLGAYDQEESAARAYDLAALKLLLKVSDYEKEVEIMQMTTKEEYLASLRRRSSGFSRGVSKYRGVARHHHNGRWEARIGRVFGNKYLYLGTYGTQEEAAHAYDIAAIEYRGINAVTNFDMSTYITWLKPGAPNSSLAFQEPLPSSVESQPSLNPIIQSDHSILTSSPYIMQDLNTNIPEFTAPKLQSSSPTALGLLLRSSVFKELVEKNLNSTNDENDAKRLNVGEYFYNANNKGLHNKGLHVPDESKEEFTLPLFDKTRQSLWNRSLSMPPSIG